MLITIEMARASDIRNLKAQQVSKNATLPRMNESNYTASSIKDITGGWQKEVKRINEVVHK